MIPKNTSIPFERTQRFVTNSDNQQRIHVSVLEGDSPDPMACQQIGDFRIYDLPAGLPKGSPVEVTYRYDSAGRIHVSAKELVGNTAAATEIVRENLGGTEENVNVMTGLAEQYEVE
jgi:molecular chaperone DnaK